MKIFLNDRTFQEKGFKISDDKNLLNTDFIYQYLAEESYWAKGISLDVVQRSIENSLCFGVYADDSQVGFARVISDYATFAYLADVFIAEKYRKRSLAKWLVQTILAHEKLQGLRRFLLVTADAQSLYAQFGFRQIDQPERFMTIKQSYPEVSSSV